MCFEGASKFGRELVRREVIVNMLLKELNKGGNIVCVSFMVELSAE